jgi:hypothetical protein
MATGSTEFCQTWRQRIETIDPTEPDARQQLNASYSELVGALRQIFQAAAFAQPAPSLDHQRAKEASDPDTPMERLWELIIHYPAETTANPIWSLLALGGSALSGEDGREPDEEQLAPLAQMPILWDIVHKQLPGKYHDRLNLSYTALLAPDQHPFYPKEQLIKALYARTGEMTGEQEAILVDLTNELFYVNDGGLQSASQVFTNLNLEDAVLPAGMEPVIAKAVLNALLPIYFMGDQLLALSLEDAFAFDYDGFEACFLDASPVADLLQAMSKTKLVKNGVSVGPFTLYPNEVYRRLAKHRNSTPQSEVAGCLHAPQDVLVELAQSTSKEIIYPLASNPMTPLPVLQKLLSWNGWGAKKVSRYVTNNPFYSQGETGQLLEMGRIVTAVDQRKHAVLLAILQFLGAHEMIPEALRQLLNAAVFAAWRMKPSQLRLEMIQKCYANYDLLMAAAWSWHWQERLAVARSPHAPELALQKLRHDGLPFIRHAASQLRCSTMNL